MKRKKLIRHRIEQRTADHKHARRRKRFLFRLAAKVKTQIVEAIKEVKVQAKGN